MVDGRLNKAEGAVGSGVGAPLSAENLRELGEAKRRAKKVRRAAAVAAFSGWSMAVFAALSLMFAILSDWTAWAVGIGLAVIAWNELRGAGMLRRIEPRGARVLGWNQVALGFLIVGYAGWSLYSAARGNGVSAMLSGGGGSGGGGMAGMIGDPQMEQMVKELATTLTCVVYGSVAVVGVVVPGLTAIYYFTREAIVRRMIAGTPAWAVEAMRAAA